MVTTCICNAVPSCHTLCTKDEVRRGLHVMNNTEAFCVQHANLLYIEPQL